MNQIQQLADMNVATIGAGYRRLLNKLRKRGFQLQQIIPINRGRYIIAKGKTTSYLITYKRELFFKFGEMFRKEGEKGVGDTLNCEHLSQALRHNVTKIFTIFPNGVAYSISMKEFLLNSHKWQNKEVKWIRSVNIHRYKREVAL